MSASKMHLTARVPNEGARQLARWIGQRHREAAGSGFARLAARGIGRVLVDRLLAGEVLPGAEMLMLLASATERGVDHRAWRRPAAGWVVRCGGGRCRCRPAAGGMTMAAARAHPAGAVPVAAPWTIPVEALDAWVAGAAVGATTVYARGAVVPRHAPGWTHARALAEDGVVTLTSRRADGGWEWLAQRRATPVADGAPAPVAAIADPLDATQRVLRQLRLAAKFGRECPSNAELARRCDLPDAAAASYRLRCLIDAQRIRVVQQGPGLPRVVTILANGQRTRASA